MTDESLALVYKGVGHVEPMIVPIPQLLGPSVRISLRAAGICGSDVKYLQGHNPWALHTLGEDIPPPPNMILGHEISGVEVSGDKRRVAILAFKGCGVCAHCRAGRENLCADMEHFGHSAGWGPMPYYPGGMAHEFAIWDGFAYEIPDTVSHEAATFLDGLAVALHALDTGGMQRGDQIGVVGLGPIGMLVAQAALALGAERVVALDIYDVPLRLAGEVGLDDVVDVTQTDAADYVKKTVSGGGLDIVYDTVGSQESIARGLSLLSTGGALVLLAVSHEPISLATTGISGERRIMTSANNRYPDFPRAIDLLGTAALSVEPLITHRFPLSQARKAFDVMVHKREEGAYKVVILP